ncbi:Hpt domain-containing protein [Yoonia sp.]|uniref:Hpt domain-containing protein n=1 Tax=Yoonia sp. TaxID=2212373 RepID=UPI002FDA233A
MSNVTHLSDPMTRLPVPSGVAMLRCSAPPAFDPEPVQRIYARLPAQEAEDLICRFLEDIALRLDYLQQGLAQQNLPEMARPARRVALAARQLGLLEVADSAGHVQNCLGLNDGVALEAVMARLERAFDVAVNEIWNLRVK